MRHIGHGVGHQLHGTRQEVENEMGSEGNDDSDDTEIDPNDEESVGEESEELAGGDDDDLDSEPDSGDDSEGCGSDDLGYASF
jgi:hypothetical protein